MKKIFIIYLALTLVVSAFAQPKKVDIIKVDFNSSKDDFAPSLTQHGRFLYFTSDRSKSRQKAFLVERKSDGWDDPVELNKEVNDGSEVGATTLTSDGQFMIFSAYEHSKDGVGRTDLYSARKVYGVWTDIQNLGPNVNSEYWDSHPTLSSDGNTLFFASDRPGGRGGVDIYMSTRTRDSWTKAVNLGPTINSESDDFAPVIGIDNKSFSFSSNRSGGLGGFDIYISKYSGNSFSTPKIAGEPINSSEDDMFYNSKANSDIAYFSSNRSGGEGGLDIFMAVPNPYESDAVVLVQGTVKDKSDDKPLGSKIVVTDLKTQKKVADLRSDDVTGNYYVVLQPGRNYSITAQKPGYVFYSERFEVPPTDKGYDINKDIYLSPLEGGDTRLLLFFDYDKTDLKDESIPELERTIEFLKDNPQIKVLLVGHTDDVGTDDYNDKLSLNRANAAKKYLINAGLEEKRIKTKGMGKRNPLVKNTTDEARASNRRVEMKIVNDK